MKVTVTIKGDELKYMRGYAKANGYRDLADLVERAVHDWCGVALEAEKIEKEMEANYGGS
jgi:hypothetical protein